MVTVTDAQEETAARLRRGYRVGVYRWAVPLQRQVEEGNEAFRTVGELELHLFLGNNGGKGGWHKVLIQEGGHALQADVRWHVPEALPVG